METWVMVQVELERRVDKVSSGSNARSKVE